ncbi:MAG: hypothetical protein HYR55_13865 [Acidobacteria bacterium]|nr:hypothetical protein [Acidobacteriota bacterium]MBI3655849.1 hypothetical protein [Acidobacteriota bacterium]
MSANRKTGISALFLLAWVFLVIAAAALADTAPDATDNGPLATTSSEYKLAATTDPDILAGRATELWARVYRPTDLSGGPFPVLVFLHGNHGTCGRGTPRVDGNCQYTTSGTCPSGYVVTPNHLGYGYIATKMASWGYMVVSINANRGITCGAGVLGDSGLNLARGRLILKHLQRLSEWNTSGGTPSSLGFDLQGTLDFSNVGLLGHSRGGEGVRAAYQLYRDAGSLWPGRIPDPVNFKAVFEIGAVDGQTSRVLNADGTVWNQLLPMCDGDVSNLQGVKPFDRTMRILTEDPPTQKSTFTVWGANHNFYNTEWLQSDSPGCTGHTQVFSQQRATSLASAMAMFRGNVGAGADASFNQNFNPQYDLPAVVTSVTSVDRGFTDSPNSDITLAFEDFPNPPGTIESNGIILSYGSVPNHDFSLRAALISWDAGGSDVYFQATGSDTPTDLSAYQTLDMRMSRQSSTRNPSGPSNFSIQLVNGDGSLSPAVQLNSYTNLRGPVGGQRGGLHPILQTARVGLADFGAVDLTQVKGVRLTFDDTGSGAIYLANIRFSLLSGSGATPTNPRWADYIPSTSQTGPVSEALGIINGIRTTAQADQLADQTAVEIEVASNEAFPVRDELVMLRIGEQEFGLSRYPENGDTRSLTFTLSAEEFANLSTGNEVFVQYGRGPANERWNLGLLDKSLLAN